MTCLWTMTGVGFVKKSLIMLLHKAALVQFYFLLCLKRVSSWNEQIVFPWYMKGTAGTKLFLSTLNIRNHQRSRNKGRNEWGLIRLLVLLSRLLSNWTDGIESDLLFDTRSFRKAILASLLSVPAHFENKSSEQQSWWINCTKEAYPIQVTKLCILQAPTSIYKHTVRSPGKTDGLNILWSAAGSSRAIQALDNFIDARYLQVIDPNLSIS